MMMMDLGNVEMMVICRQLLLLFGEMNCTDKLDES